MKQLIEEAIYELRHYPKRSLGWHTKRIIKLLTGRYAEPLDKINWPTGLLANGLIQYYQNNLNTEEAPIIMKALKEYFSKWINGKHTIYYLDDVLCGMALIELHQITGEVKYKQALEDMVQYLYHHEADEGGALFYRPKQRNGHIYVDGIGMICPFLCKYGRTYNDSNATNLAIKQIQNFIELGMDDKTGLPYHGYEYKSRIKYGIVGWGRAVGWLMMGMVDSLIYLEKGTPAYDSIKQAFRHVVDKAEAYQVDSGMYPWQMSAKEGPIDTSATAMILYSIAKGLKNDILIGIHRSRMLRGREALFNSVKQGKIYECLAECGGFGIYPQQYDAYPWSLGPAISLFTLTADEEK